MNRTFRNLVAGLVILACVVCMNPTTAFSDNSSEGAAITVGLLAVVIGVLVIIGIASDVDYYSRAKPAEAHAAKVNGVQINTRALPGLKSGRSMDATPALELAGSAGLGLRIQF